MSEPGAARQVAGAGLGDLATGYSDYASLGAYTVAVTVARWSPPAGGGSLSPPPPPLPTSGHGNGTSLLTFAAAKTLTATGTTTVVTSIAASTTRSAQWATGHIDESDDSDTAAAGVKTPSTAASPAATSGVWAGAATTTPRGGGHK